ncbi:hypothetical protein D3C77_557300 [compost metagenome]
MLLAVEPVIAHRFIHDIPVPEASFVSMESGCLIAVLTENLRENIIFVMRITNEYRACRQGMQRAVRREVSVRGTALTRLMIKVREVQALLHQPVKMRRNLLISDFLADHKIHESFNLNHNDIALFICAKSSVRLIAPLGGIQKPPFDFRRLLPSERRLAA